MLRMILGSGLATLMQKHADSGNNVDSNPENEDAQSIDTDEDCVEDKYTTESWAEWLVRTTHTIEEHCQRLNMRDWLQQAQDLKGQLARRVREQDYRRWSKKIIDCNYNVFAKFGVRFSETFEAPLEAKSAPS